MAENNYECQNCGYDMSPYDETCKYCGSKNPNYRKSLSDLIAPKFGNTANNTTNTTTGGKSTKNKLVCGLLQIFLGCFGVGRFYSGHTGIALAQLFLTIFGCGAGAIWGLIDGILILCNNNFKDSNGNLME